jgi:PIN domain nuclease of toxin-antitoxin system
LGLVAYTTSPQRFAPAQQKLLTQADVLFLSRISCWEVAKLVEKERLQLTLPVSDWLAHACQHIELVELHNEIIVASTQLIPPFHKDPADQLIVATAQVLGVPLCTADQKIIDYPHVKSIAF